MNNITFIGGGNMAAAIIGGLVNNGKAPASITVIDPNADQCAQLHSAYGITIGDDMGAACASADTIVLAVKPQIIAAVAEQITQAANLEGKMLVSIAAGVTTASLEAIFGAIAIARTMPNTPALLGLGATGLFFNPKCSDIQKQNATDIITAFGICVPVEREDLLDAVTAVSGSGPAYYFLMIEEMIKAGEALGLSHDEASALTIQTALGAAKMAQTSDVDPAELRRRVTSPNGTTHAAITSMQEQGFGQVIETAMVACRDRAIELGKA